MGNTFFCPFCCSSQQTQVYEEDGVRKVRCTSCGCPAEAVGIVEAKETALIGRRSSASTTIASF